MEFKWTYQAATAWPQPMILQTFLKQKGFSKAQLARLKFSGGQIFVNHRERYTNYQLHDQDVIRVFLAPELAAATIQPSMLPIEVIYEDDLFLVLNKPAGVPSIPSRTHATDTIANRVKGYLQAKQAESLSIHIVTRLDMDTSGLIIFAKNAYGHSVLAQQAKTHMLQKSYLAIAQGQFAKQSGLIDLPIGREKQHSMKRVISATGKASQTAYEIQATTSTASLVKLALLTGRTHQIRVHLAALGHPLYGDQLYGGPMSIMAQRQALHCTEVKFYQPIKQQEIVLTAPLPTDMAQLWAQLNRE
ncbi:RluA family pseudouridine synthase [Lapidilactobacillus wuchangensis]|uniref:RluA family pseudouridine synthase n=1 Tax=Lapidilactobacillus wuchangensis TaxID=2486001 RepID=UPI000F79D7DD|nr:RluA family pseudouridine synthase [Lapidilactobacillus wuchangensis]